MTITPSAAPSRKPVIQVFCRAYLVEEFRSNFEPLADRFDFRFLCDGDKPGTPDTREAFYSHWRKRDVSSILTHDEIDDCIRRCRMLRSIDRPDALRLLHAMALTLDAHLEANRPALIVCHMVDEYVTHLLAILAGRRGIIYLGYIYSYFPGYVQFIQFSEGRGFDLREPGDEEAHAIVDRYSAGCFRRDYAQKKRGTLAIQLKSVLRYRVKLIYFWIKSRLERDPLNVHYLLTPYIAEYRHLHDLPPRDAFDYGWREKFEQIKARQGRIIFLPLGYFPESAIDYWVSNTSIIDYEGKTIEMLKSLTRHFTVAVKEHPHMVGARRREFYDRLAGIEGVIMVPPEAYATEVMDETDAILLGGGSGGVEARLRNRPVFSFCDSSYWFDASGATFLDLNAVEDWPSVLQARLAQPAPDADGRLDFAKACLRSTVRESSGQGRWPLCEPAELERALTIAIERGASGSGSAQGAANTIPNGANPPIQNVAGNRNRD